MDADSRDPHGHMAEFGWRPAARGTHAEKKPARPDARVKETRPGKVRCAPSALAGVGKQREQLGPTPGSCSPRHVAAW